VLQIVIIVAVILVVAWLVAPSRGGVAAVSHAEERKAA